MDSLDRRLVELNQALMKLLKGETVESAVFDRAEQVLAGQLTIDTGPGNDVVIINTPPEDCDHDAPPSGVQGPQGATGAQGPQGATGAQGAQGPEGVCKCKCKDDDDDDDKDE